MKIFAFGHRRFVGKDTAVRFAINHLKLEHQGLRVKKISFAESLKAVCYKLFKKYGLKPSHYYEEHPTEKEIIIPELQLSARDIWIIFGTKICREIHPNVWVDLALDNLEEVDVVLTTDLRFVNEAEAIKKYGGILIRIERNVATYDDVADSNLENYSKWNYIISNNTDLQYLHKVVTGIIDHELTRNV